MIGCHLEDCIANNLFHLESRGSSQEETPGPPPAPRILIYIFNCEKAKWSQVMDTASEAELCSVLSKLLSGA